MIRALFAFMEGCPERTSDVEGPEASLLTLSTTTDNAETSTVCEMCAQPDTLCQHNFATLSCRRTCVQNESGLERQAAEALMQVVLISPFVPTCHPHVFRLVENKQYTPKWADQRPEGVESRPRDEPGHTASKRLFDRKSNARVTACLSEIICRCFGIEMSLSSEVCMCMARVNATWKGRSRPTMRRLPVLALRPFSTGPPIRQNIQA
ncbi:unnamed protein product [Protopolystoma xenopodis]|uniref:Uncharacterized protein n=1 Tax=Protopolystoma xenopodis TaxID=117903 RepID=A0A3S4ZMM0_9PLAT|nr:unnamed protein product [Protopolystoma xenopodis]